MAAVLETCKLGEYFDVADVVAAAASEDLLLPSKSCGSAADEATLHLWGLAAEWHWDGDSDEPSSDLCVLVRGSEIESITSVEEARLRNVEILEFPGCTLLPGLIDCHVHLEFSGEYPLHDQPAMTLDELDNVVEQRALSMLKAGIVAVRDLGNSARYPSLRLRDSIEAGLKLGPRIVCAGQPVTVPNGHCHQWGGAARSSAEAAEVVRRQAEHRTDWIKVMVTGGVRTPGSDPQSSQFSEEGLRTIVETASAFGLPVAGHAHGAKGVALAVAAGCRTVEHCSWLGPGAQWGCIDDGVIDLMARQGTHVAPTAHANWRWRPMGDRNFQRMSNALKLLKKARIPLLASSDAGAIPRLPHDALAGGIEVLAEMADLRNVEALKTATSAAATALRLDKVCGRLKPALSADLLVVYGDACRDLSALRRVQLVVARGKVVQREDTLPPPPANARDRGAR